MKVILKCSLCVWLLASCAAPYGVSSECTSMANAQETISHPIFRVGGEYLYRATIRAYGRTFNGLLAAKLTTPDAWRIALTTDFGNTLFDFERQNGKTKANYVTPDLNKKMVVNTLATDFHKLLNPYFVAVESYICGNERAWKSLDGQDSIYWYTRQGHLQRQENIQGKKLYTTILYNGKQITLTHHTLQITITLEPLQV